MTLMPVGAFPLGEAKINEDSASLFRRVKEVCWFDVAMQDTVMVYCGQSGEEALEVEPHVADGHLSKVFAEVAMLEEGENGNDLVMVSKGGDEWTD